MYIDIFDTSPITGSVRDHKPLDIFMVSGTEDEVIWDELVEKYHYLGHEKIMGRRVKYLALWQERPVAALSFHSAIPKIECRDSFIGWSSTEREKHLHRVVDNNRFLILPWVKVKNLASHLLARVSKRLAADWSTIYGTELLLVETYVDLSRYQGTCYRAANWVYVGETKGYSRRGLEYEYHGNKKGVFVYPLKDNFREILGLKPIEPNEPRTLQTLSGREREMLLARMNWDMNLLQRIGLNPEGVKKLNMLLFNFHESFEDCFGHIGQVKHGLIFLKGLMSNITRKTLEAIALEFSGPKEVRLLQHFFQKGKWNEEKMMFDYQETTAQLIAHKEGMKTVDSTELPKKGKESVGVARQYCGILGKTENCQSGVFVGYTSPRGYALLDRQLYMPEIWFSKKYRERRERCEVPTGLAFMTKPQIAALLLEKIDLTALFPAKWIGMDAVFGSDCEFLDAVSDDYYYFADQRANTLVWLEKPAVGIPPYKGRGRRPAKKRAFTKPMKIKDIATAPDQTWQKVVLGEGAKGPIFADRLCLRVITCRDKLPHKEVWLYLRKHANGRIKYSFSNAPSDISISELDRAALMRWPIEQSFENAKSHLGMDEYEHRSWPAWHRHMLYVMLAMLFLLSVQYEFADDAPVLTLPQAKKLVRESVENNHDPSRLYRIIRDVGYHIQRNYEAYLSHRKRVLGDVQME